MSQSLLADRMTAFSEELKQLASKFNIAQQQHRQQVDNLETELKAVKLERDRILHELRVSKHAQSNAKLAIDGVAAILDSADAAHNTASPASDAVSDGCMMTGEPRQTDAAADTGDSDSDALMPIDLSQNDNAMHSGEFLDETERTYPASRCSDDGNLNTFNGTAHQQANADFIEHDEVIVLEEGAAGADAAALAHENRKDVVSDAPQRARQTATADLDSTVASRSSDYLQGLNIDTAIAQIHEDNRTLDEILAKEDNGANGESQSPPPAKKKNGPHPPKERSICQQCNESFTYPWTLKQHMKVHVSQIHKCRVDNCGKFFAKKAYLKIHEEQFDHDRVKPFKCPRCVKSYAHECNLSRHQREHKQAAKKRNKPL